MHTEPTPLDLLGEWALHRTVDDARSGIRYRARGSARLTTEADRVRWHETGTLEWDGGATPFFRTLFVEREAEGWQVLFEDGRPFHPWVIGTDFEHLCVADLYTGGLTAESAGWRLQWHVTGPQKDYVMATSYHR